MKSLCFRDGHELSQNGVSLPSGGMVTSPGQQSGLDGMSSGRCESSLSGDSIESKPILDSMGQLVHIPMTQHSDQVLHNPHTPPHPVHHPHLSQLPHQNMLMSSISEHQNLAHFRGGGSHPGHYTVDGIPHGLRRQDIVYPPHSGHMQMNMTSSRHDVVPMHNSIIQNPVQDAPVNLAT